MSELLSDEEVICTFMEPCPRHFGQHRPGHRVWWEWRQTHWRPIPLDLDALWLVEEALMNSPEPCPAEFMSWGDCIDAALDDDSSEPTFPWHYGPARKIHALAVHLRPLLTG